MRLKVFLLSLFLIILSVPMTVTAKSIYGLYESVQLEELGTLMVKAKLDTGALTSSFGATDIKFFKKDGKRWVRFKPQVNALDLPVIEKELVRYSKIKTRNDDIRDDDEIYHSKRPVVLMNICFDGHYHQVEVNLTDRSRFNYPLLLGRSALIDFNAVVDPSLRFQSKSSCSSN